VKQVRFFFHMVTLFFHMVTFRNSIIRMSWFSKSATVEVEAPPLTSAEQLGEIDRQCAEAEQRFNRDAAALRTYNLEHTYQPLRFKTGDVLRIQTLVNDLERQQLERAFRKSYEHRNRAWSTRADLMLELGLIR